MAKPTSRSTLYQLIEAGQLAHQALVVPLRERGLEPGDDAIMFILGRSGTSVVEIAEQLDLPRDHLDQRIARLEERDIVRHQAVGPELTPGLALTERGIRIRNALGEHWDELEAALLGDLKKKKRLALSQTLARFIELLRL